MVHKNFKPDQTSRRPSFLNKLLGRFGLILTNSWVQLVVILATGVFLSIGVYVIGIIFFFDVTNITENFSKYC